jgi:hypothetical protein
LEEVGEAVQEDKRVFACFGGVQYIIGETCKVTVSLMYVIVAVKCTDP